jgi:hypothetical protein
MHTMIVTAALNRRNEASAIWNSAIQHRILADDAGPA